MALLEEVWWALRVKGPNAISNSTVSFMLTMKDTQHSVSSRPILPSLRFLGCGVLPQQQKSNDYNSLSTFKNQGQGSV